MGDHNTAPKNVFRSARRYRFPQCCFVMVVMGESCALLENKYNSIVPK